MLRSWLAFALLLSAAPAAAETGLSSRDTSDAFRAAGFTLKGKEWHKCDDPGTASYTPGQLEPVGDLNGDGSPEAVITESSTYCYGNTGTGFSLVSRQAGHWKLMLDSIGIPTMLSTKGVGGWPDIEIGGPGFCFPVLRWNGREYKLNRQQYEGKPCRR
ncbi:MAG: hypothetical protein R3E09_08920 [Novosphingobium sp.]